MRRQLLPFISLMLVLALLLPSVATRSTLAQTSEIDTDALLHDSRSDLYRSPAGAVPTSTTITLRLRAAAGDLDSASLRMYRATGDVEALVPMQVVATSPDGYDFWEAQFTMGEGPSVYWYRFIVSKGGQTLYYEDDTQSESGDHIHANEGGAGTVYERSPDLSFQISAYRADYYTPEWMRNGVIYQIFPDRFRNGDTSNDPADDSDVFYGELPLLFHETWNEPPVDGRSTQAPSGAGYYNSDFYGGDLAGITEKLDYLQALGVTGIYLNPIFEARSNHRYDTADYKAIDPYLGTLEDFQTLVAEAEARGIVLILDGVFNHLSSDSLFFDRYNRFETDGACESVDSPYRNWFYFNVPTGAQPDACVDAGDGATFYTSWFNFDSIPKIDAERRSVRQYFILAPDSVTATWGQEGIGGWRLDVAGDIDAGGPANNYWELFRQQVRRYNPEGVIIGEEWNDASKWLLGNEWDSVMNYRLRRAILGVVRDTDFVDNDGRIDTISISEFDAMVRSIAEDYPAMANNAMMNLLGSHDTSRLFFVLDNNPDWQRIAALLQFSLPGAPTIYYGDEVSIDAPSIGDPNILQDDPYNRAPYPWDDTEGDYYPSADEGMLGYYQAISRTRHDNPALREGELITLAIDDENDSYAFLRLDRASGNAAVVAINNSDSAQTLEFDLAGIIPNGLDLYPVFEADAISTSDGLESITVQPHSGNIWTVTVEGGFVALTAPSNLSGIGHTSSAELTWDAVEGASSYVVYRSPVAVGGFEAISDAISENSYVDDTAETGFQYFYRVVAVGNDGLLSEQSEAALVVPSAEIEAVFFVTDSSISYPISTELKAGLSYSVQAGIRIPNFTEVEGATRGILAEAALLSADADPETLTWYSMSYVEDAENADIFAADLPIGSTGDYIAVVRFSNNAGNTWQQLSFRDGLLPTIIVSAAADSSAPEAPATVTIERASLSGVTLVWDAVTDEDLYGYRVYRSNPNGETVLLGEVSEPSYTDVNVSRGASYSYAVSAIDNALNESAQTATEAVLVERQSIPVTFIVTVPEGTQGQGAVYIAGNLGADYPNWDPAGLALEEVDATHWQIVLDIPEGSNLEYKYARGSWEAVEKGTECEEINNRRASVNPDTLAPDGTLTVEDTVAKWRDLDQCG